MDHLKLFHNVQPKVAIRVSYCILNPIVSGMFEKVPQFNHDFLSMVINFIQFHGATK